MAVTLAQKLAEGRMRISDVLRAGLQLAGELRKVHDNGLVHGAVCPHNVELNESGVALLAGVMDQAYAAPEVISGQVPDARSDVYSFGTILFEMFTGNRPQGARSTGSPIVDRLVMPCLAENRGARAGQMPKVILDLRLLKLAVRRAAAASAARALEVRLAARMEAQDRAIAEMQRSAAEAVAILRGQVSAMQERGTKSETRGAPLGDRVAGIEQTLETMQQRTTEFEQSVAADLLDIEDGLRKQSTAMDAARAQIAQTDVVVERMVQALEALQRAVLDRDSPGDSAIVVN
jgi:hypothetical protein